MQNPFVEHPGIVFFKNWVKPHELHLITPDSYIYFARELKLSTIECCEFLQGEFDINNKLAATLASYTHTTPAYWVRLQNAHDFNTLTPEDS